MQNLSSHFTLLKIVLYISVLMGSCLLYGCHFLQHELPDWQQGELVVLEEVSQSGADAQLNHELAKLFATYVHAKLTVVPSTVANVPELLARHQAHIAAFGLRSNMPQSGVIFAPSYQTVAEQLVFNDALDAPTSVAELVKMRIAVLSGSAQEAILKELKLSNPMLRWESRDKVGVDDLLDEVSEGKLDATFANQQQFGLAKSYYDNLGVAKFGVVEPSRLAWAFAPDSDAKLREQASQFFALILKDGRLHDLLDRFYGFNERLAPMDAATFLEQMRTTLPRYRALFTEAAHWSGLDWELVAALAYQESHWDPLATSPTNVRGMMMLTEDTADHLNVEDRLDARQSTLAGARYLASIRDQLPEHIPEPDRTWMALAAYNQGNGHLEDARILTQRMGMDADRWVEVRKWMPKLTQPQYFEQLPHGYARGGEAVVLVENIRMYYDMIKHVEAAKPAEETSPPFYRLLGTDGQQKLKNFSSP